MESFVKATKKKMKRKDLDQVSDDFSDFSLSSPARKIRRLDAELPPIMEDEEPGNFMSFEQPSPTLQGARASPIIEELPPSSAPVNEERAIVLFKPVNSPILQHQSSSTLSVSVDPDLISEFKNRKLWASLSGNAKSSEDDAKAADKSSNKCMAVVPWYPAQFTPIPEPQVEAAEEMEAEEMGEATMEIEDSSTAAPVEELPSPYGEMRGGDASSLPQWQHCMTPQFPPTTTSSPIVWFR
ncbi:uncharacterized protein LOC116189383 [Punica granatum]|uniref:Uncharacterized protein n=2 Tax=Punica granatum TaxID=22663 RepID=A0A218XPZ0_PUNGR|nr:uncharacterized protein LOC116189383 [Punica granatum]OWM86910.1 hypothetical protein CDL15_Pgr015946 [Punica granatum]PKI38424.1 hypothetical protein CRG98_041204 [Punica granatum]